MAPRRREPTQREMLSEFIDLTDDGNDGATGPAGPDGSDGSNSEAVLSTAPVDGYQVKNIYVDATGPTPILAFEYDDTSIGVNDNPGLIASNPPAGAYFQVQNVYVEDGTGRLVFAYDDGA